MIKVSVIIPVYNSEKTLKRCVDSVLAQTLSDVEIILVDDGSTDQSGQICDDLAGDFRHVKVVHKENGGLVSARKAGVRAATGDYVGYVDSDDWVSPDMYERLYQLASEYDADMVSSGYVYEGGYTSYETDTVKDGVYAGAKKKELLEQCIFNMDEQDLGIRGSLCCKLFRRSILSEVQMQIPESISYSEDKLCVLTFLLNCKSVYVTKECYYHYLMNASSMTVKPNKDYLIKVNEVYKYLCSLYDHPDFTENMRHQAELYVTQLLIKGINSRMGFSVPNLMWIDTYWQYDVPEGSRVLLCGSGALRDTYERQIQNTGRLRLSGEIEEPADASGYEYDFVVITYKYEPKAQEVRRMLEDAGVSGDKILWFEQKEVFWKYAQDAGLCNN